MQDVQNIFRLTVRPNPTAREPSDWEDSAFIGSAAELDWKESAFLKYGLWFLFHVLHYVLHAAVEQRT